LAVVFFHVAVALAADKPINNVKPLESEDQKARTAFAGRLVQFDSLPTNSTPSVLVFAKRELTDFRARKIKPIADGAPVIVTVPLVGDEASLVRLKASPKEFIDKDFFLVGALSVESYFNYGYGNAGETHFSLRLTPVTKDGERGPGDGVFVYAVRQLATPLVDAIANREEAGASGMVVRVKVSLLSSRTADPTDSWDNLELRDWQVLSDDRKSWVAWQLDGAILSNALIARLPPADAKKMAAAILDFKTGDKVDEFIAGAIEERLMLFDKKIRTAAAHSIRPLVLKIKDKDGRDAGVALMHRLNPER
jgi:hypothetical protein